jgi:hypothetical protein
MPRSKPPLLADDAWSMDEAADQIGVHPKTLTRMHRAGLGPPRFELKRVWWYRKEALKQWLLERERRQVEAEQRAANPEPPRAPGRPPQRSVRGSPPPVPVRRSRRR